MDNQDKVGFRVLAREMAEELTKTEIKQVAGTASGCGTVEHKIGDSTSFDADID